jgi:hypothetical protein
MGTVVLNHLALVPDGDGRPPTPQAVAAAALTV